LPGPRRGGVQIRFEILEHLYYSPGPQPRTHVWRKATTLSYDDYQRHIAYLAAKGLIKETGDEGLSITKEGREVYEKLRDALGSLL
jgi:predicted transcriptional regulator